MRTFVMDPWPTDLAANDDLIRELLELAGVRAEEAVGQYLAKRRRAGLGKGTYGTSYIVLRFSDRKLLNAFKRLGAVSRSNTGGWNLAANWRCPTQEMGMSIAMDEAAATFLKAELGKRALVSVYYFDS